MHDLCRVHVSSIAHGHKRGDFLPKVMDGRQTLLVEIPDLWMNKEIIIYIGRHFFLKIRKYKVTSIWLSTFIFKRIPWFSINCQQKLLLGVSYQCCEPIKYEYNMTPVGTYETRTSKNLLGIISGDSSRACVPSFPNSFICPSLRGRQKSFIESKTYLLT